MEDPSISPCLHVASGLHPPCKSLFWGEISPHLLTEVALWQTLPCPYWVIYRDLGFLPLRQLADGKSLQTTVPCPFSTWIFAGRILNCFGHLACCAVPWRDTASHRYKWMQDMCLSLLLLAPTHPFWFFLYPPWSTHLMEDQRKKTADFWNPALIFLSLFSLFLPTHKAASCQW